jgi:hypothetical protein
MTGVRKRENYERVARLDPPRNRFQRPNALASSLISTGSHLHYLASQLGLKLIW